MRRTLTSIAVTGMLAGTAVPALAATKTISVKDNFFVGATVNVRRGTTVTWLWRGHKAHNVTAINGPVRFASRVQKTGRFSRRLTRRGTYRIVCTLHPGMRMTLKVT